MKNVDAKIAHEVEQTLSTLDELQRVQGNPYLLTRVRQRLREGSPSDNKVSSPVWIWNIVALLVLLNVFSLQQFLQSDRTENKQTALVDYFYQQAGASDLYDYLND